MIKALKVSALATTVILLSGCGGTPVCMETQPYEQSRLGKHVEAPEGLDSLDPRRELTIPEASPPPRAANAECLELPPTFRIKDEQPQQAAEEADDADEG